jgi:hypothetical protein
MSHYFEQTKSLFFFSKLCTTNLAEEQTTTKMSLFDEVIMTDSGNDSESGHSSTAGNGTPTITPTTRTSGTSNNNASSPSAFASLTAGGRLAKLLAREQELIKTLEELTREIEQLEKAPEEDESSKASAGNGEEGDGDDEGDDLEEFEAPEWCVPIKANVMTYDWDVSFFFHGPGHLVLFACFSTQEYDPLDMNLFVVYDSLKSKDASFVYIFQFLIH